MRNCSAIARALSPAQTEPQVVFEESDGGTLFLDEIGDPPSVQTRS